MVRKRREKDVDWIILHRPDLIELALMKARRKAIEDHKRAGLPLVFWENGRVIYVKPEDAERELNKAEANLRRRKKRKSA